MKASHMWMCGVMVAIAVLVIALGGSAWILVPALGCMLMMGAMMWMMMGAMGGNARDHSSDEK